MSEFKGLKPYINIISGFPFASSLFSSEEGVPLIRIRDLMHHKTETFYMGEFHPLYGVNSGDILIGMDGDFNAVQWRGNFGVLNQRIVKVLSSSHELDSGYLYFCLQPELNKIHARTPQTTVKHLSTRDVEKIEIRFFPIPEQQKIAKILTTIDNLLEQTQALIGKYQAIKQGLMQDLFTRGVDKNGALRPTREQAPELYKETVLGWIPLEWEVDTIENHCNLTSGGTPSRNIGNYWGGDIPWVKTGEINYNIIGDAEEKITVQGLTHSSTKIIPKNTLLMAIYGEGITRGKVAILGINAAINQACLAFLTFGSIRTDFLFYYFSFAYEILRGLSNEGSQKNLSSNLLKSLQISVPKDSEQIAVVKRLSSLDSKITSEQLHLEKLRLQKQGLMQDLLTGKKRVQM